MENQAPYDLDVVRAEPNYVQTSIFLDVTRFELAQRVAKMLSTGKLLPAHFQNNIADIMIAMNLADRFKADPFMVMQNVYLIHGKPALQGTLVIALVNQCGKFTTLQFRTEREKDKIISCTAYATEKNTGEVLEHTLTHQEVEAEGWNRSKGSQKSKWLTLPALMYKYRSATFFARVYCPEVLLGMQTVDELVDIGPTQKSVIETNTKELTQALTFEPKKEPKKEKPEPSIGVRMGEARPPKDYKPKSGVQKEILKIIKDFPEEYQLARQELGITEEEVLTEDQMASVKEKVSEIIDIASAHQP